MFLGSYFFGVSLTSTQDRVTRVVGDTILHNFKCAPEALLNSRFLEIGAERGTGEGDHVANVAHPRHKLHNPLKA